MIIDCDTCVVRHQACDHCVVGVLLGTPGVPARSADPLVPEAPPEPAAPGDPLPAGFGPVERRALEVLADHGLVPHLRLLAGEGPPEGTARAAPRRRDVG